MKVTDAIRWLSVLPPDADVDISIRSVRMGDERRGPKSGAQRSKDYRVRKREVDLDSRDGPPLRNVTIVTERDEKRDGRDDESQRGTMGDSPPESAEKPGEEREITEPDLSGSDGKPGPERDARHEKTSRSPVDGTPAERAMVARVFDGWKQDTGHHKAILDKKRGRRILARLREGFTPEQLLLAITNRRNDRWLMGLDDSPRVYDDIENLLRDAAQVERLERLIDPQPPRVLRNGVPMRQTRAADLITGQLERARDLEAKEAREAQEAAQ